MAVTRLIRKEKRNRAVANNRVARIKFLTLTPVVKNVDVEGVKAAWAEGKEVNINDFYQD